MLHCLTEVPSILDQFVAELRDVEIQKDRLRFRRNLERIAEIMAFEMSKSFAYQELKVQTPLGVAQGRAVARQPLILTILRAGIPMQQGMLNYLDKADAAFISAFRVHKEKGTIEVELEYAACPSIQGRDLIVCDPMLATGSSLVGVLDQLHRTGKPSQVHVASAIAAKPGIEKVTKAYPHAHVWVAAIDDNLDENFYIVPGLGDAGDLAFGSR